MAVLSPHVPNFFCNRTRISGVCVENVAVRSSLRRRSAIAVSVSGRFFVNSVTASSDYEQEELNEDIEWYTYLVNTVQILLHLKYRIGSKLTDIDARLIQEQVLRFHPRFDEKIGCGLESLVVSLHPEHDKSRCFIVNRSDGSSEDFSYRKCMIERARLKGIPMGKAKRLLNMDYMDLSQTLQSP